MLTPKDKEVLALLKDAPNRQMVVEAGGICHIGDVVITNPIHRLIMLMALTEIESQGVITRYELSRTGLSLLREDEFQSQILGAL